MRWSLLILSSLFFCSPSWSSRLDEHHEAVELFENLHFFAEGRGMMLSPGLISAYDLAVPGLGLINRENFSARWGIVFNDEDEISGLHNVEYKGHRVGVVGCVVCHSGRAAGQFIVGLGNKNIDVFQLGQDIHRIESFWKTVVPFFLKSDEYVDMEDAALDFSSYLANEEIGNLTQGLVPISFIRGWFYRVQNQELPHGMSRGQVKVPHLWGYGEKRKVGQFCDGFGDGEEVGWAVAVELAAGQKPEVVQRYYPKVKEAEEALEYLLPPVYPFAIDQEIARRGQKIFSTTCANCHGHYHTDAAGLPVYEAPKWVAWDIVRTDLDRVGGLDEAFSEMVRNNPLSSILRHLHSNEGYFAPRLNGVWARFPYLHNGSVPTVYDLLQHESKRPKIFSLENSGEKERFDSRRVGLTLETRRLQADDRIRGHDRAIYDVSRVGHSNQGHNFFTDLAEEDKFAILEYLKTL